MSLALLRRQMSGEGGAALEVPMLNASMSAFGYMSLSIRNLPARYGSVLAGMPAEIPLTQFPAMRARGEYAAMRAIYDDWLSPFYSNYQCADGRLFFLCAGLNRLHLDRAIRTLRLETMLNDLGFRRDNLYSDLGSKLGKNIHSVSHWSKEDTRFVRDELRRIFAERPAQSWEKELGDAGVPCTVIRSNEDYVRENFVRESNLMCKVVTPEHGDMWQPNRLVYFPDNVEAARDIPSPKRLDEDRQRILSALDDTTISKKDARESRVKNPSSPLTGITVLDLTNVISGPTCGRTLAECGADVIKIDTPTLTHGPGIGIILGFDVNRGKRSVLLNLKTAEGGEVFERLVQKADVVIYNGPDAVMQRLGLTYENLSGINPRVILCQLTAYGSDRGGAWSHRRGYDEVVQAADGCQVRFGGAADPLVHGTASCLDYSTGYAAAFAVALALIKREETGVGSHVCTSLALAGQLVQLPFCFDYEGRGPWDEPQGQDVLGSDPLKSNLQDCGWLDFRLAPVAGSGPPYRNSGIRIARE
ncbi:crotonobetainyl-CoA:carnitine CoA-transferase CaiB-like acyl-CoA transferase [Bradyrhizobium sp. GM0.4]